MLVFDTEKVRSYRVPSDGALPQLTAKHRLLLVDPINVYASMNDVSNLEQLSCTATKPRSPCVPCVVS